MLDEKLTEEEINELISRMQFRQPVDFNERRKIFSEVYQRVRQYYDSKRGSFRSYLYHCLNDELKSRYNGYIRPIEFPSDPWNKRKDIQ